MGICLHMNGLAGSLVNWTRVGALPARTQMPKSASLQFHDNFFNLKPIFADLLLCICSDVSQIIIT